ncbi:DUF1566 domain-containing protein [Methylophilus sp. Leaf408]|uniref:Lcl domain-containing protein n=1 Tax=Methylophilus sp. Leaf408 TaxID=2876561 RepID=UPI001E2F0B57|nr:DUF1566 domain-containing protein [Methylophilus sp. Leaf408]
MFSFLDSHGLQKFLIAGLIALNSLSANAELTPFNSNGVDLVYSSVSDVTWTKDANLIYSMINDIGFNELVSNVIAANSTTNSPLSVSDFENSPLARYGWVSWAGGMAFANYLNTINYGGRNNWRLPTVANTNIGWGLTTNDNVRGDELSELFYKELGGSALDKLPDTPIFDNEQFDAYWTGTEFSANSKNAWIFMNNEGNQQVISKTNFRIYAWFISPGQTSAVPESKSVLMLFAGLGLIGLVARRRNCYSL